MKIATKLLVLVLVVLMCFGSLIACGGKDGTTTAATTTTTTGSGTTSSTTGGEGPQTPPPGGGGGGDLPYDPYSDETIGWEQYKASNMMCTFFYKSNWGGHTLWIEAEDAGVNKADVATLARLDYYKDLTGITMKGITTESMGNYDMLKQLLDANEPADIPDIFFVDPQDAFGFTFNNYLLCLNDPNTPNMNFDLDCWHQNVNDNLAIWGNYYVASGYWDTINFERAEGMYFDRDALETINPATIDFSVYPELAGYVGEDSLYEWAENGEWTWDKLVALAKLFAGVDGTFNGDIPAKNGYQWSGVAGLIAVFDSVNLQPFKDDESGVPSLVFDSVAEEKLTYIYENFAADSTSKYANCIGNVWNGAEDPARPNLWGVNHTCLFASDQVVYLQNYAKLSTETTPFRYGILPMPKWNEQQENYYANTETWFSTLACIPKNVSSVEFSTFVLQTFTIMGRYKFHKNIDTIYEAVVEDGLSGRYAGTSDNAEKDKAMLQIIMDSTSASFWEMAGGQLNGCAHPKDLGRTLELTATLPNFQQFQDTNAPLVREAMYAVLVKLGIAEAA